MIAFRQRILWRRALDWLATYHPVVIAVTGSTGKSTTAAAIQHVLAPHRRVRWSTPGTTDPASVALAILGVQRDPRDISWYQALTTSLAREIIDTEPDVLILDLAADRPGDIDGVARYLKPDITVVTNVGTTTLELFDTKDNIAHEFSSLAVATPATGTLLVNADDDLTRVMPTLSKAAAVTFGAAEAADVRLRRVNRLPQGGFAAEVATHKEMVEMHLPHLVARQHVSAVVAALAVGHVLHIPLRVSAPALHTFMPRPGHWALVPGKNNSQVLDDSSNATFEGMMHGLETLRALPCPASGRRIAIIGDLDRLGRHGERIHRSLGRLAAQTATIVIVVGEAMRWAGMEALQARADVHHFDHAEDAGKWVLDFVQSKDTILVSGGKEMHMGKIVERLAL